MAPFGLVELKFFDTARELNTQAKHRIFIFINAFDCGEDGFPKLTRFLSRSEFDNIGNDNPKFCDDRTLSGKALVVYEKAEQHGQTYQEFLQKITKGRTFSLVNEDQDQTVLSIKTIDPGNLIEPRSVSYINTDLNDFGRGNDLRESPKDLKRDFGREMYNRMRININDDGDFAHLRELEKICHSILRTPQTYYSDPLAVPQSFRVSGLRLSEDQFEITIRRDDGSSPIPISFLSAGENEVFFVILMILNLCRNTKLGKSIILLDEPDLHIANSSRNAFFSKILNICEGNAQLIISTHSPALYELVRRKFKRPEEKFKVITRSVLDESPLKTRMSASYDGLYLGKICQLGYKNSVLGMLRSRILMFFAYQLARIRSILDFGKYTTLLALGTWVMSCVFFALMVIGAIVNDALNFAGVPQGIRDYLFSGKSPTEYHDATRIALYTFSTAVFVPPIVIGFLRLKMNKNRERLLKRLRK